MKKQYSFILCCVTLLLCIEAVRSKIFTVNFEAKGSIFEHLQETASSLTSGVTIGAFLLTFLSNYNNLFLHIIQLTIYFFILMFHRFFYWMVFLCTFHPHFANSLFLPFRLYYSSLTLHYIIKRISRCFK